MSVGGTWLTIPTFAALPIEGPTKDPTVKRSILFIATGSCLLMCGVASAADPTGAFTADQYKKALWMTTRYFGAVRSGNVPNWATQDTKYPTSFVKDAYKGNDVSGGWFDCGDHVMFGQTQFYAAYILAKGYASWKNGFTDAYHGDFSDYKIRKIIRWLVGQQMAFKTF